jgi:hypothetical protein
MAEFIFAYHGGRPPKSPEEGAQFKARWRAWVAEIGDAFVHPGSIVGKSWTVSANGASDNGGPNPLSGYSIVTADSIEAALDLALRCPHVEHGTIEVAEVKQMPS